MNERIQKLIEQATTIEYGVDNGFDRAFFDKVKFAELMAAECISIVEGISPGYKDYRDQIEDAFRRDCVAEIKHKFGVE